MKNNFESRLPGDVKKRKEAVVKEKQTSLTSHLQERSKVVKYSDALFHHAALEWLVATDQV